MRMCGRLCKDILNDPFRQFSGALVLFRDNLDPGSHFNIRSVFSTHYGPLVGKQGAGGTRCKLKAECSKAGTLSIEMLGCNMDCQRISYFSCLLINQFCLLLLPYLARRSFMYPILSGFSSSLMSFFIASKMRKICSS